MTAEYRITPSSDNRFVISDLKNEYAGTFFTRKEAEARVTRYIQDPALWESAKLLIHTAIAAQMEVHWVSRDAALFWVKSAAEIAH